MRRLKLPDTLRIAPHRIDDSHTALNCMPKDTAAGMPNPFGVFSFHFSSPVPSTSEKLLIKNATSISNL